MAGLQICPEELGMENQVLTEFRMMLIETDVANIDRRQLDSAMRTSALCLLLTFEFYGQLI